MKNIMYGVVLISITVLVFLTVMTVNGQSTRKNEMNDALASAVKEAVTNTMEHSNYSIEDNKEFVADFMQSLLNQFSNNSNIEVAIMGIDYEKGLMSVKVTQHYQNPNGKEGQAVYDTTVIMEDAEIDNGLCTISFYLEDDDLYKEYQIAKGDSFITPTNPSRENKKFVGWKNDKKLVDELPDTVTQSSCYYAVFK